MDQFAAWNGILTITCTSVSPILSLSQSMNSRFEAGFATRPTTPSKEQLEATRSHSTPCEYSLKPSSPMPFRITALHRWTHPSSPLSSSCVCPCCFPSLPADRTSTRALQRPRSKMSTSRRAARPMGTACLTHSRFVSRGRGGAT